MHAWISKYLSTFWLPLILQWLHRIYYFRLLVHIIMYCILMELNGINMFCIQWAITCFWIRWTEINWTELSMMPSKRTRYDQILRRMSPSVLAHLLTMSLSNMQFPAAISRVMIVRATVASGRRGRQMRSWTRDVFSQTHAAYETVKSFLYGHSIACVHKEKILNLELTMFHLKCKVSNKRHKFFGKSYFQSPVMFALHGSYRNEG
jgi:hypothetical protein